MRSKAFVAELIRKVRAAGGHPGNAYLEGQAEEALLLVSESIDDDLVVLETILNLLTDEQVDRLDLDATPWFEVKP